MSVPTPVNARRDADAPEHPLRFSGDWTTEAGVFGACHCLAVGVEAHALLHDPGALESIAALFLQRTTPRGQGGAGRFGQHPHGLCFIFSRLVLFVSRAIRAETPVVLQK